MTDKQKELLAKYSRIANDKSQLQQFAKDLIMGEIVESPKKLYKHRITIALYSTVSVIFDLINVDSNEINYNKLLVICNNYLLFGKLVGMNEVHEYNALDQGMLISNGTKLTMYYRLGGTSSSSISYDILSSTTNITDTVIPL